MSPAVPWDENLGLNGILGTQHRPFASGIFPSDPGYTNHAWYPQIDHRGLINPSWTLFQVLNHWKSSELFQFKLPLIRNFVNEQEQQLVLWPELQGVCLGGWNWGSECLERKLEAEHCSSSLRASWIWFPFFFLPGCGLLQHPTQWAGPGIPALGRWRTLCQRCWAPNTFVLTLSVKIVPWDAEIRWVNYWSARQENFPVFLQVLGWPDSNELSCSPSATGQKNDLITEPQNGEGP